MLYPELFDRLERARWNMHSDIPWHKFDARKISDRQLHGIKMNAILEWSSMPTTEMFLRDNPNDVDFCAFISIWFYEEQKHSLVLLEYLRRFAPEYLPSESELAAVRFDFDPAPALDSLALHFCGEVRLNLWYKCARDHHSEPVIKKIYEILSNDEARHARSYYEYMRRALSSSNIIARDCFSKIGVLMTNSRVNKAMHPTNLHVNKKLYPADTVNGRLPDPEWLSIWLNKEIDFNEDWERRVEQGILGNYSSLFGADFKDPRALRNYRNSQIKTSA
ncbi:ferritin [Achromobacter sp. AGC39]